jgi:DNA-directed RNA polymerase subunit beta
MPFLADGTPLDIVLNPMGVPSRMNIGQVFEVHLGIAVRKLGWKIMTPVFDGASEKDITECMKLAGMYREVLPGEYIANKNIFVEDIDENGETVYNQVSFNKIGADEFAPVYAGEERSKAWVDSMIEDGKLKIVDGNSILYDGRTGERFQNPVTVGIMYYLKLHHLVDDKIHARSTGPVALVTQQPL